MFLEEKKQTKSNPPPQTCAANRLARLSSDTSLSIPSTIRYLKAAPESPFGHYSTLSTQRRQ